MISGRTAGTVARGGGRTRAALAVLLLLGGCAGAPPEAPPAEPAETVEHRDLSRHFEALGAGGSFVLYDAARGAWTVHDSARVSRGFIPASTFKLPNTLIALETGVVRDVHERFAWDSVARFVPAWNQDHTLATGLPASAVWLYQEVARRVGEARMREWVERLEYGNRSIEGGIDTFWLTGGMRITPREQVDFLRRLHAGDLPVSEASLDALREIMRIEERDGRVLRGKTGWAPEFGLGWLVGWVEREEGPVFFATQIEGEGTDFPMRRAQYEITRGILAELEVYR